MEPVALSTKLGYVLSGPITGNLKANNSNSVNLTAIHVLKIGVTPIENDPFRIELRRFRDYESCGIQDKGMSINDRVVEDIEFVDSRYQVRLPFKEYHEQLPDNFLVAK